MDFLVMLVGTVIVYGGGAALALGLLGIVLDFVIEAFRSWKAG